MYFETAQKKLSQKKKNMTIFRDINIRATTDKRFWGRAYPNSIYLWESAKHNLTLRELAEVKIHTLEDPFPSREAVKETQDYCRTLFYKYLGILSRELNEIHGLELPEMFWRTVFGWWLYRHISIVYDKYIYLQQLDIDRTSITLLSPSSFYIPKDHYDYVNCFCNEHGVIQLISQYYYLFAQTEFEAAQSRYELEQLRFDGKNPQANLIILPQRGGNEYDKNDDFSKGHKAQIAICCTCYTEKVINELSEKSLGKISTFQVPAVKTYEKPLDLKSRDLLAQLHTETPFEKYLAQTLSCCIPKILVEYFRDYYDSYSRHIRNSSHTAIVTECWMSFMPVSIYCAIARQQKGVRLIFQQHCVSHQWLDLDVSWLDLEVADRFITTGWQGDTVKSIAGGFATRERLEYQFEPWKYEILHVCTTRFPYLLQFGDGASDAPRFLKYLRNVNALIDMIPPRLKSHFVSRPRRDPYFCFWDTEHSWDVKQRGIRVKAEGDLVPLMMNARIVIIDHMSTALSEVLFNRIPFILLYLEEFESLSEAYADLFDDLIACGVMHKSPSSAVEHLARIYDNVEAWWQSELVQHSVDKLKDAHLAPASQTTDYLLSLLTGNDVKTHLGDFMRDNDGVGKSPASQGAFGYSDGAEREDRIFNALGSVQDLSIFSGELRRIINDWVSEYHFSQERHNLLRHLQLCPDMNILELGCGCGAITRQLGESGAKVTAVEGSLHRARCAASRCRDLPNVQVYCFNFQDIEFDKEYDLVTFIGVLEYSPQFFKSEDPVRECLRVAYKSLKPDGVLLVAIENQLGLKYFSGLKEDHVDIPYFGIEDRYSTETAVTFGRRELIDILKGIGFTRVEFHYPFPDYKVPKVVFTEKAFRDERFRPEEIIRQLRSRDYAGDPSPAFAEQLAVPPLCRNKLMEDFSNSFLVLASRGSDLLERLRDPDLLASFYTTDRADAYNVRTDFVSCEGSVRVHKRRLLPGLSPASYRDILTHCAGEEEYIPGLNLEAEYLKYLRLKDLGAVSRLLSLQINFFLHEAIESPHPDDPVQSIIRPEFIDCIPANLVLNDNHLFYIDREWRLRKPVSLGALLLRTVDAIHALDHNMPELNFENLVQTLHQGGFRIGKDTIREYQALIREMLAQIYEGAYPADAVNAIRADHVRGTIEEVVAEVHSLPESSGALRRVGAHLQQVLSIRDGQSPRASHLAQIAGLGQVSIQEIALCRNFLRLMENNPSWDQASEFLRYVLEELNNGLRTSQVNIDQSQNIRCNPQEKFKRFAYGNTFTGFVCPNPFLYAELHSNGDLSNCCYLPFVIGNIREQGMDKIWNSETAQELRRSILSGEYCYCDQSKCATMQQTTSPFEKDLYEYQVPYRMIKKERIDNAIIRESVETGKVFLTSGPEILSFDDDLSCNLSCPSCRKSPAVLRDQESQEVNFFARRLLDTAGNQVREVWFAGSGDPFASKSYRDLFQNYDFERFSAIGFRLDTNGMLLTERTWNTVLDKIKHRIRLIAISADAATESTYAAVRRGGNFHTLLDNLHFITELPQRRQGMGFILRMIVQQKNFREMKQFVELGRSLGVDGVVFSVVQNWGAFTDSEYLHQAIHLPDHPEHEELLSMLRDPIFGEPSVDLGNLSLLYYEMQKSCGDKVKRARVIAFYLPQFHPIPENDEWWGKGFTEWTNTAKAKPLFDGHYQPHLPADLGYYDLRMPETRQAQADLARKYGVEAFCYWHYWFGGHRLLERPFDEVLRTGQPDFPFCLGWANQTWSGIWHGAPDRILIEQTYPGLEDYKNHFNALLPAFCDSRYLKVNGKLLFLIYAPQNLPDAHLFANYWQELAHKAGLSGFHFVAHMVRNPEAYGCQACVDNAPFVTMNAPMMDVKAISAGKLPSVYHYAEFVRHNKELRISENEYPLVVPNWDNTPRSGANGVVLHASTPELFGQMMEDAVAKAERKASPDERIIFVKAWNEWAEGNHLEPDMRYGHGYLQVLHDVLYLEKVEQVTSCNLQKAKAIALVDSLST